MKKKLAFVIIGLIFFLPILACSTNPLVPQSTATAYPTYTPLPTMTPVPTQTQLPTQTPLPTYTQVPTSTPVPTDTPVPTLATIPGIDSYLSVDGVRFKVTGLDYTNEYSYQGETYYPTVKSDAFAIVFVEFKGEMATFKSWMIEGENGLSLRDDSGRQSYWSFYDVTDGVGKILFVVDGNVDSLVLVFLGGEEIDLTPFLMK